MIVKDIRICFRVLTEIQFTKYKIYKKQKKNYYFKNLINVFKVQC